MRVTGRGGVVVPWSFVHLSDNLSGGSSAGLCASTLLLRVVLGLEAVVWVALLVLSLLALGELLPYFLFRSRKLFPAVA